MKQLILIALIFIGIKSFSQEKGEISISFGTGESDLIQFTQLDGAGSSTGLDFYTLSLGYVKPINSWLDFRTGLDVGYHRFKFEGAFDPNIPIDPKFENAFVVSIPITFQTSFFKYFFFNAGALIDMDINNADYVDSQTGIGAQAGFGAQYQFKNGFGLFINPLLSMHTLIPFTTSKYPERIFESGVRFGVSYKL
jgi:hypothetical protein